MLNMIRNSFQRLREQQEGATAVEYGIMVAAIAAVIVVVVFAIGQAVDQGFDATCSGLDQGASIDCSSS